MHYRYFGLLFFIFLMKAFTVEANDTLRLEEVAVLPITPTTSGLTLTELYCPNLSPPKESLIIRSGWFTTT